MSIKHYDSLIIEKTKYEAILRKSLDNLDVPIYINSTPKGVYRFNLFNVELVWVTKYLKKTTTFSNNKKVPKEIAYLPVIDAEKIMTKSTTIRKKLDNLEDLRLNSALLVLQSDFRLGEKKT